MTKSQYIRAYAKFNRDWAAFEVETVGWNLKSDRPSPACYRAARNILAVFKGALIGYLFIILTPILIFAYLLGAQWFISHGIVFPASYTPHLMNIAYGFLFYAIADMFGRIGRTVWWILFILVLLGCIS